MHEMTKYQHIFKLTPHLHVIFPGGLGVAAPRKWSSSSCPEFVPQYLLAANLTIIEIYILWKGLAHIFRFKRVSGGIFYRFCKKII